MLFLPCWIDFKDFSRRYSRNSELTIARCISKNSASLAQIRLSVLLWTGQQTASVLGVRLVRITPHRIARRLALGRNFHRLWSRRAFWGFLCLKVHLVLNESKCVETDFKCAKQACLCWTNGLLFFYFSEQSRNVIGGIDLCDKTAFYQGCLFPLDQVAG